MSTATLKKPTAKKIQVKTWSQPTRYYIERICELIYSGEEHKHGGDGDSLAAETASAAECLLHYLAQAPLDESLWSPADEDPINIESALHAVVVTVDRALITHSQAGGLNDVQAAVLPLALSMLEDLRECLNTFPISIEALEKLAVSTPRAAMEVKADATEQPADSTQPSTVRHEIARTACQEVSFLADAMLDFVEKNDSCGTIAPVVRSGLMRMMALSDIIFEAVITDNPEDSDDELVSQIGGRACLFPGSAS